MIIEVPTDSGVFDSIRMIERCVTTLDLARWTTLDRIISNKREVESEHLADLKLACEAFLALPLIVAIDTAY